jgi:hypothetical protein
VRASPFDLLQPVFRRHLALATTLLVLMLGVPSAAAGMSVLQAYQTHGSVPPCQFTSRQLEHALAQDPYGAQYFNDFTNAIQTALQARATGACSGAQAQGGQVLPSELALPRNLVSATGATRAGPPAPVVLMALLATVLALATGVALLARLRGWDPAWAASWRHMWSEAGYRTSGRWADLTDWWRSRRG